MKANIILEFLNSHKENLIYSSHYFDYSTNSITFIYKYNIDIEYKEVECGSLILRRSETSILMAQIYAICDLSIATSLVNYLRIEIISYVSHANPFLLKFLNIVCEFVLRSFIKIDYI